MSKLVQKEPNRENKLHLTALFKYLKIKISWSQIFGSSKLRGMRQVPGWNISTWAAARARSMRSMLGRWKWSCPTETGHNDKHHIVWCVVSPLSMLCFRWQWWVLQGHSKRITFGIGMPFASHPACYILLGHAYEEHIIFGCQPFPQKEKNENIYIYIEIWDSAKKPLYIVRKKPLYIYIEIWDSAKKPGKKTKLSVWINIWLNHDKSQYIATPK